MMLNDSFTEEDFNLSTMDIQSITISKVFKGDNCYIHSSKDKQKIVNNFILKDTPKTKRVCSVIFYPSSQDGKFTPRLEFKILNKDDTVKTTNKDQRIAFNSLEEGLGEFWKLINFLSSFKHLVDVGGFENTYQVISNVNNISLRVGKIENREQIVKQLRQLENDNFENLGSVIGRARLENVIEIFEQNLNNSTEAFWENFLNDHPWILQQVFAYPVVYLNGETYLGGKNSKGRQGQGGSATDFLFMNGSNGSFAVVEIKTPNCNLVGPLYRGQKDQNKNNELFSIHADLTGGIVQMEHQIYTAIEYFKTTIGEDYKDLNHLNPSGVLIAGNYSQMNEVQQKSFNLFRKSLSKNFVYTFDEILSKLKLLKTVYES